MSDLPLTKRSVMTLFSDSKSPTSHRVRLVAKEKDIPMEIIEVEAGTYPEDLLELNPYATLPTLIDRDLVITDPQVMIEYLDERFPHPPLMSVDPISKARARQLLRQIEVYWYPLVDTIMESDDEVFEHQPYFMSNDYSLVDVSLAVLMWRLPAMGIELPKSAKPIIDYAEKILSREFFNESLSDDEIDMRDVV